MQETQGMLVFMQGSDSEVTGANIHNVLRLKQKNLTAEDVKEKKPSVNYLLHKV